MGRFLVRPGEGDGDKWAPLWRHKSQLLVKGRTSEAKQLPGAQMRKIECVDDTSLPSTHGDEPIKGALKYAQIGANGSYHLLTSAIVPS